MSSETGYRHIDHGFEPVFDARSRVLVLGSFPSVLSRRNAFFYGNPRNRFWRVVAACVGAPVPPNEGEPVHGADPARPATLAESIEVKRRLLLDHGLALWDVVESCDIKGSSDASIRRVAPVRIERVTSAAPIERVLCNGAAAARLYDRHLRKRTGIEALALPSTSPANAAWSLDALVARWSEALG